MKSKIRFLILLAVAAVASAQTIDTGNIQQEAGALMTLFEVIGAVAAVVAIIFAALAIRGRNVGEGIVSLLCAVGAIFVIGHAQGWVTSITGITLP